MIIFKQNHGFNNNYEFKFGGWFSISDYKSIFIYMSDHDHNCYKHLFESLYHYKFLIESSLGAMSRVWLRMALNVLMNNNK